MRKPSTIRLGLVATARGGTGFPERLQGGTEGIPFIKVSDMNLPGNERYIHTANNYISPEKVKKLGARVFSKGDIVFAKVGAALLLNRRRVLTQPTLIDNNLMAVTPESLDGEFLRQFLLGFDMADLVQVGALPSINQSQVHNILIPEFSNEEQRGIAEVLSALDEEIEATEALIRKKTAVKRALAMTLMPKPHGLVGANWRETSFGALVVSVREKFLPTEQERTVPCVNLEDVPEGEGRISGFTSAADNLSTKTAFKKGDILFGKLRPYLRKFAITPFDGVCTTEILVFRAVKDVDPDFVFQLVASDAFIEHNVASSYGTKMPRTDWRTAASFPVALPSLAEQRVIGQTLSAADAELAGLRTEAAKLRLQKQGLMKDLLTGAVRV